MTSGFSDLRKRRKGAANIDRLRKEAEKLKKGGFEADDRLWKPTTDKSGNAFAVIRFLPEPNGEDLPWVRLFNHGFKGPGGWFFENSLTTIGKEDPVSDYNRKLWNTELEANRQIARNQKRRLNYYANIYVVKDSANPDTEGKVFLYRFGKKIFDKINDAMSPEFEDDQPLDPFDMWTGANFRIKVKKVAGFWNYDSSSFSEPAPLFDDDTKMKEVWEKCYSLQEFLDPKNFKTYEELQARLTRVINPGGGEAHEEEQKPSIREEFENRRTQVQNETSSVEDSQPERESSSDDELDAFAKLLEDD